MSDTPRTDAIFAQHPLHNNELLVLQLCGQLERELKQSQDLVQKMSDSNRVLMADVCEYRKDAEKFRTQRDTLLEQIKETK